MLSCRAAAERLRVPRSVYDEMIVHARSALPDEAVGLLGGMENRVLRCLPLPNALCNAAGRRHFLADPHAQYCALRTLAAARLRPLAVYHSHPGGGVDLSDDDLSFARHLPYLQLVIALDRPHTPAVDVALWAVSDRTADELFLDVMDE